MITILRFLVEGVVPLLVFGLPWYWAVKYFQLRKRVEGLDKPELWLSKSERQDYARTRLQREAEEHWEAVLRRQANPIRYNEGG